MNYQKIVSKQREYNDREVVFLDALFQSAVDLRLALTAQMGMGESYFDEDSKPQPYLRLLESSANPSRAAPLSKKDGMSINPDGSLAFVIRLMLEIGWEKQPIYIMVGARIFNGEKQYSAWHSPNGLPESRREWGSLADMLAKIEVEIAKYYAHDPSVGDRVGLFIY